MAVVGDLDDIEGVCGDFDEDGGGKGVEGVVEQFFDEGGGVVEDEGGAESADCGGREGVDGHVWEVC